MQFVRQLQMIKVMNLDGKVQIDKETRKHGDMRSASIRAVICGPSNCDKTNVLINLLESSHDVRFENMYLKSLQQSKYQY